ncbi:ribose 5-phosphate isomerase B [Catalinimonas alkaloidigena]|uniref:Ribose 5-phosphate isomerase B n=1 Tax=Catalinimonas alkaloidigena TaxID=1075417 RepID=A0A1G9LNN7_9BACT|nr:RpiB/LacA/LacB family sugar-phosphate isomerase [Catalinimonas alkaloidigena]SDL63483.1 ribose 5-phosphate isomerase B [Catalinimonas alkaloidigena]
MKKLGLAADHGGYELKEALKKWLSATYEIQDFGADHYDAADDYPDFVIPLSRAVAAGEVERGIAVCGSGVGATMVANRVPGVRACLITETYSAHQGVEHDALNVLCLGGRVTGIELAREIVAAYLRAEYSGEARHERRLSKMKSLERP